MNGKPVSFKAVELAVIGTRDVTREVKASGLPMDWFVDEPFDNRLKSILSVNAQGRVSEYRLQLTYTFRIVNQKGQVLVPPNEVAITRDVSYDDSNILAKESEENLLWRDMTGDLVNQIMRRLSIIKPKNPDAEEDDE